MQRRMSHRPNLAAAAAAAVTTTGASAPSGAGGSHAAAAAAPADHMSRERARGRGRHAIFADAAYKDSDSKNGSAGLEATASHPQVGADRQPAARQRPAAGAAGPAPRPSSRARGAAARTQPAAPSAPSSCSVAACAPGTRHTCPAHPAASERACNQLLGPSTMLLRELSVADLSLYVVGRLPAPYALQPLLNTRVNTVGSPRLTAAERLVIAHGFGFIPTPLPASAAQSARESKAFIGRLQRANVFQGSGAVAEARPIWRMRTGWLPGSPVLRPARAVPEPPALAGDAASCTAPPTRHRLGSNSGATCQHRHARHCAAWPRAARTLRPSRRTRTWV